MNARIGTSRIEHTGSFSDPKRWLRSLDDLLTGAPRLLKTQRDRRVKWIEGKVPDSDEAAAILEALATRGCETYGSVTRYAADLLFRRDLMAGGWAADIGLFHSWYLLHACESLERLRGRLVWIEDEASPWS
jgi:hypothetical protein